MVLGLEIKRPDLMLRKGNAFEFDYVVLHNLLMQRIADGEM
jgi:hypothetical protein